MAALCAWPPTSLVAQAGSARAQPHHNSVSRGATHAPKPELPPLVAWHFVKTGNAAFVALREQAARLARHGIHSSRRSTSEHGPTPHAVVPESGHGKQPSAHGHEEEHGKPNSPTRGEAAHGKPTHGKPTAHGHDTQDAHHGEGQHGDGPHGDGPHGSGPHGSKHHDTKGLPQRPAGASKYVCAVITCADMPFSVADLCGLDRKDVLAFRMPGLRANAETVAMLERVIEKERLSLVLVLGHSACDALRVRRSARRDVLDRRAAKLQQRAEQTSRSLLEMAVHQQREQIVAGSDRIQQLLRSDQLRVLPGIIDARSGAIDWKHRRAAAMPLSPVK